MAKGVSCLMAAACGFAAVGGVRISRKKGADGMTSKMIAGVPVLNAETAKMVEDWVVVAQPGTTDEQLKQLCEMSKCMRVGHPSKKGIPYFEIRATEEELETVLKASQGAVEFAEPDGWVYAIPEFPGAEAQNRAKSWGLSKVGVDTATNQGQAAHVYVLDTGILQSHTDFGGRVEPTLDLTVGPLKECAGDLSCAGDSQGHGTHCAGTAAGTTYGVAPRAQIYTVKVLGDDGRGQLGWSYDALDWIASSGNFPAVASMSLGSTGTQAAMKTAVDSAVSAGVVVVVAGGNSNSNACGFSPAFVPSAITVGSTDPSNQRSSFSNYGACTDIWAPGRDIVSASHTSPTGSRPLSGTSMACPHVSGAAAILLTQLSTMSSSAVIETLLGKATKGAVTDLKSGDTNALLWIGAGPAPTVAPLPEICNTGTCTGFFGCLRRECRVCPQC